MTTQDSSRELEKLGESLSTAEEMRFIDNDAKGKNSSKEREKWGSDIEFLLSCIALSVGLGNIWRFPFVAYENGGGAFIVPYIIVVLVVGRPIYYMEILLGQFSGRGCVQTFGGMVACMKGVGYGQMYATVWAITYYASVMALTMRYVILSFNSSLPWSTCMPEWGSNCVDSGDLNMTSSLNNETKYISSAELFFTRNILKETDDIENGIGAPNWDLVACLSIAWIVVGSIVVRGIKSSGKIVYFLATFPYIILLVLLVRVLTLPGSLDGVIYFLKPQWSELLNPKVWYSAITQVFFSLAICFGTLIMYASYNNFHKKVYSDVTIITIMDSTSSILGGCIIFGILGNLAHETNAGDIAHVVKSGTGLAFISYPEAIAKFRFMPQLFSVLFFLMLFLLGIGSSIGMLSAVMTVVRDKFGNIPNWLLACSLSICGFLIGLIYLTPGGQFLVTLIDFYCCSFIAIFLAIGEVITVAWIYGIKRFCHDIEFMLNVKTGLYWRICWAVITPCLMIFVLIYSLISYQPLTYKNIEYPEIAYNIGWIFWAFGVGQLPFWMLYEVYSQDEGTFIQRVIKSLQPSSNFAPSDRDLLPEYIAFLRKKGHTKAYPKVANPIA